MCWSDVKEQIRLNLTIFFTCKGFGSFIRLYLIEEIFKHEVVVVITGSELHILRAEKFYLKCQSRLCSTYNSSKIAHIE